MGDKVRIKLISANLAKRQMDYEWVLTGVTDTPEAQNKAKFRKNDRSRDNKPKPKHRR